MSSGKNRWSKFWWQDYERDPALRSCSLAAQGLWMRMLCFMHEGVPYGHLTVNGRAPDTKRLAAMVGKSDREVSNCIAELEDAGVFNRDDAGTIFSRRMIRDQAISSHCVVSGLNGGNPTLERGTVPKEERVRPYRRSDSPEKTERIFQKRGGACWWCDVPLTRDEAGPTFFHVDHLVPVRDGGTNDESNLVPACAKCNHERARKGWSSPNSGSSDDNDGSSDNNVGNQSDDNPLKLEAKRTEAKKEDPPKPPLGGGARRRGSSPKFKNGMAAIAHFMDQGLTMDEAIEEATRAASRH